MKPAYTHFLFSNLVTTAGVRIVCWKLNNNHKPNVGSREYNPHPQSYCKIWKNSVILSDCPNSHFVRLLMPGHAENDFHHPEVFMSNHRLISILHSKCNVATTLRECSDTSTTMQIGHCSSERKTSCKAQNVPHPLHWNDAYK
jgi:hypothetical protein